ncbi:MAG: hypothetical protein ACREMF_02895, partial [Gemmatimonadales bacterium]
MATSTPFEVTPASGPRLLFTVQPSSPTAGAAIAPAVQVTARDSLGNTINTFTEDVTVAIAANAGGGTLSGTLVRGAVGGVATFSDLSVDKSAAGYTLTAVAPGAATGVSAPFDVAAGSASQLVFVVHPSSAFAGSAISPPVQVIARDDWGNRATGFTGDVRTVLASNPSGAILSGDTTVAAVAGEATFSSLRIDKSGTGFALSAIAPGLAGDTSAAFEVIHVDQSTSLVFSVQPSDATAGARITPAVVVTAVDQGGNPVGFTGTVTVSFAANPAGGILSGTATVAAVAGVATFSDLYVAKQGSGYALRATAGALVPDTSVTFSIATGAAARILVAGGDQQTAPAGTTLPVPYSVRVTDGWDNSVTAATVNWAVMAGGGSVSSTQGTTDSVGVASTTRTLGPHPDPQTVQATVAGLADSAAVFSATATPNGTISGTITRTSGFLAPPLPGPTSSAGTWLAPREPRYTPDELVVTFRAPVLSAPPIGSAGLAAPA